MKIQRLDGRRTAFSLVAVLIALVAVSTDAFAARKKLIKIYVDESRSFHLGTPIWKKGLGRRDGFFMTRVMDTVKYELLRKYDVMVVWNLAEELPYSEDEIRAIRTFVERGGGLLLIGSAGPHIQVRARFQDGKVIDELQAIPEGRFASNQIASLFGLPFANVARPGTPDFVDAGANRGVDTEALRFEQSLGVLAPTTDRAELLLTAFGHPVAASTEFGKGRVIVCGANRLLVKYGKLHERKLGTTDEVIAVQKTLGIAWLKWLAQGSPLCGEYPNEYPKDVLPGCEVSGEGLTIHFISPFRDVATGLVADWEKVWSDFSAYTGAKSPVEFVRGGGPNAVLHVYLRAGRAGGGTGGTHVSVPALGTEESLIGVLGHEVGHKLLRGCNVSMAEAFAEWMACRALRATGRRDRAEAKLKRHLAAFREVDPTGNELDIADPKTEKTKSAACQGKWIWILRTLEEEHGATLMRKYLDQVRQHPSAERRIAMREVVQHLSRAAGKDLVPWFRQMGITVSGSARRAP